MSLDQGTSDLIRRIYCDSGDPAAWERTVADILDRTNARIAFTTVVDLEHGEFISSRFYGVDETAGARGIEEYGDVYHDDPTLIWATKNPTARFCDSHQALGPDEYRSHMYIRWQRDRLRSDHWVVGYTPPERARSFSFSLLFPVDRDSDRARSIELFRMLFDHMDAAVQLASTPFAPQSTTALLLLDATGNVIAVSERAARLILLDDGLDVRGGRLAVSRPNEQRALDAAIGRAADVLATGAHPCAVRINRPSGAPAWLAIVRPEFRNFPGFEGIAGGISVELRAGAPPAISPVLLQSVFCLTEREAEVVLLLYNGHSIASLAHSMEISPNTARVHLHAAFAKTSTTRQSELIQLCSRLAEI